MHCRIALIDFGSSTRIAGFDFSVTENRETESRQTGRVHIGVLAMASLKVSHGCIQKAGMLKKRHIDMQ
jgi:hypothetical protein